jgi:hypothetical protein
MTKQWRITVTVDKDLYLQLEERAKREARTLASLGKYLLLKGLEGEKTDEITLNATSEDDAA